MHKDSILFYGHRDGEYKSFSNFYPCTFEYDGMIWSCSEQAYMYYKSEDKEYRKKIKKATDPFEAKALGRKCVLRKNWDNIKFNIMVSILEAKFSQNKNLKEILLSTGDLPIHEDCKDPWWGGGPNHPKGKDLLGKALILVRRKLK